MKILLLAPANNVHTKKWVDYYSTIGYKVVNVSLETHKETNSDIPNNSVKREYLHLPFNNKLSYLFTSNQLKNIISKENPDILHSHYASSYGLIGALSNFHPFVLSVWGSDIFVFPRKNLLSRKIIEFSMKNADVICATSNALLEETKKYSKSKPIVITPFGVDTSKFKPMSVVQSRKSKITIGIVKGMDWKYGIEYLLKAFHHLKTIVPLSQYNNLQLLIVGDGPYLKQYQKLAKKLDINKNVKFTGRIEHSRIVPLINSMDIFVVPSLVESFGVAAIEAQACGVPVIASNVGGLPEVVVDGETGYIVPCKDFKAVASKLKLLIENPTLRKELGENAISHIHSHYKWEENAKIMKKVYEDLV